MSPACMSHRSARRGTRPHRRLAAVVGVAALAVTALGAAPAAAVRPVAATVPAGSYVNPVGAGTVSTFADPSIVRGKDGWWYAYTTGDQVRTNVGDFSFHRIGIIRSRDQVHWSYVGDVFPSGKPPAWQPAASGSWAPDIRYLDGRYVLYYSVANPPPGPGDYFTVAAATAPTPAGPWTDSGGPVIPPKGACDTFTDIDPAQITDATGQKWLEWGSFRNLCVARLRADGLRTTGPVTEIYRGQGEGGYIVAHDGWYYLFVSENNCCIGETSSYQVRVGRSRTVDGPYVDADGIPLVSQVPSGTFVVTNNGNRFVGPGHNAVSVDRSGQSWLVYHAVPRDTPRGGPQGPGLIRQLMIDRLDWIGGWPVVRAGAFASDSPQQAPADGVLTGSTFDDAAASSTPVVRAGAAPAGWAFRADRDSGRYVSHPAGTTAAYLLSGTRVSGNLRVEADLRQPVGSTGAAGLVVGYRSPADNATIWLDAGARALVGEIRRPGQPVIRRSTALPAGFRYDTWHDVTVELRASTFTASVTDADQSDPVATLSGTLPGGVRTAGLVGVAGRGTRVDADNVVAARLFTPVTTHVPAPRLGRLDPAYSDEFTGTSRPGGPGSPWTWVRTPVGTQSGGAFHFPTTGELFGNINDAPVLTRPAPAGDYTVEAKFDWNGFTSAQQAGLVVYAGDDEYLKLTTVYLNGGGAIAGDLRTNSFAKDVTGSAYSESFVGAPGPKTQRLRIYRTTDPVDGEQDYRAATSRDGKSWTYGATWTLPAGTPAKIAIAAMNTPGATADFDYLRVYR